MNISTTIIQKTAAAVLMCIFLMPMIFLCCWQLEKIHLFKTIEERFKTHKTVTLAISAKNITWIKQNRELLFNGHLFDVSTIEIRNQQAIITGHFDMDEDEINKKISQQATPVHENPGGNFVNHYLKIFNAVTHQAHYSFLTLITQQPARCKHLMQKVLAPARNVATPPPNGAAIT